MDILPRIVKDEQVLLETDAILKKVEEKNGGGFRGYFGPEMKKTNVPVPLVVYELVFLSFCVYELLSNSLAIWALPSIYSFLFFP